MGKMKNETKEIESRKKRRKNFDPHKWARKWLRSDPLPKIISSHRGSEYDEYWKNQITCHRCKKTYGGGELLEDGNVYCAYCQDYVKTQLERERLGIKVENAKYKVGDIVYIEEKGEKRATKILDVYEGIFYKILPYSVEGEVEEHKILGKVEDNGNQDNS